MTEWLRAVGSVAGQREAVAAFVSMGKCAWAVVVDGGGAPVEWDDLGAPTDPPVLGPAVGLAEGRMPTSVVLLQLAHHGVGNGMRAIGQ